MAYFGESHSIHSANLTRFATNPMIRLSGPTTCCPDHNKGYRPTDGVGDFCAVDHGHCQQTYGNLERKIMLNTDFYSGSWVGNFFRKCVLSVSLPKINNIWLKAVGFCSFAPLSKLRMKSRVANMTNRMDSFTSWHCKNQHIFFLCFWLAADSVTLSWSKSFTEQENESRYITGYILTSWQTEAGLDPPLSLRPIQCTFLKGTGGVVFD